MYYKLREAKDNERVTNEQLAELSGVPDSNIERFMRGDCKIPNAFYLAAICKTLNLSADELLGIKTEQSKAEQFGDSEQLKTEVDQLRLENLGLRKDIEHERQLAQLKDKEIASKTAEINSRRPLIYILIASAFVMALALMYYLGFDHNVTTSGLIIDGQASALAVMLGALLAVTVLAAAALLVNVFKTRRKGK